MKTKSEWIAHVQGCLEDSDSEESRQDAVELFDAAARIAIVKFADRVGGWLSANDAGVSACHVEFTALALSDEHFSAWASRQILAAALGERTLP